VWDANISRIKFKDMEKRLLPSFFKVKNVRDAIIITLLISLWSAVGFAQTINIRGNVTDASGKPLNGVAVQVRGTPKGTYTNVEGKYTLQNVSNDSTLSFSILGMHTQIIKVNGRKEINVLLETATTALDEVVAIGYASIKKADLTGSVSSVSGNDISDRKTIRISQALQGALPGVSVTRSSSGPGDNATIRIRGITTIGNSDPLYIIDGVPGDLSIVNPNEIESVTVLKDAASASIYGSKAAAGVVLIKTKRGVAGKNQLTYDFEYGVSQPTRIPKFIEAVPYMKMANELIWNDKDNTGSEYPFYSKDEIDNYSELHAKDPDRYPNTDWSSLLKDYTPHQSHRFGFSGGSDKIRSNVSLSYDDQDAITNARSYKRIMAWANNDIILNKMFTAHIDLHYYHAIDKKGHGTPSAYLLRGEPVEVAFYKDGRVSNYRNGDNRWAYMLRSGSINSWANEFNGKASLDFTPIKGLKITGVVAPDYSYYKQKDFVIQTPMTSIDDPSLITGYVKNAESTNLNEVRNDAHEITTQLIANYSTNIGDHDFTILAGNENYYSFNESLSASRDQYALNNYPYLSQGPLTYRDNSGSAYEYSSRSYFGRIIYDYKGKYLFQSNARYDGSSRFASKYRWGLFPSLSVGWVLSKEQFLKTTPFLSFLKIRASWGTLGNERIGNYPYQSTIGFGNSLFYEGTNVISSQTAFISKYAIEDISWETTKSMDIGIDAAFFDNKLQITADYYNKVTSDMLLPLEIPDYIGLDNPDQNTGKMRTKGWELDLKYSNKIGELHYSISANIFDSKSAMGYLGGTQFLGSQVKMEGSEFNEWYGYVSNGIYQNQDEIDKSATLNDRIRPGDISYVDISGPDGKPDGIISPAYDRVLLGGSLPRYQYGGRINLGYKGFDLSIVVQGVGKINSYKTADMVQPLRSGVYGVPSFVYNNYWSKYNSDEKNEHVSFPRLSQIGAGAESASSGNNYVISDFWLFNGAYFRLKNVGLGYNLPSSIVDKVNIESVRLSLNISDAFSIDKYPKGYDPESSYSTYFIMRQFDFGISVTF